MSTLVFLENLKGKIKDVSLEAAVYAHAMEGGGVTAIVLGAVDNAELTNLGKYGVKKVLCVQDERIHSATIGAYASALSQAVEQEGTQQVVLAYSLLGGAVAAQAAIKLGASYASNVVALPDTAAGFVVRQSIHTGKAFMTNELKNERKIIGIKKNAVELKEVSEENVELVDFNLDVMDSDFTIQIESTETAKGDILLPEANIVVSGGRGMKGPEHWGILEELANVLGAATACSKPVSDMGWRPHHEHVGQTGIKVAPQLYIAVGISGAIQHLAGVNSSRCIVVINKDEDAPFFKAADYGIVGDAFNIIPKLTKAIRADV